VDEEVADDMANFPKNDKTMIYKRIVDRLSTSPVESGKRLKGDLHPLLRLRVGNYRVIYQLTPEEHSVLVLYVAHRKEVYQGALATITKRLQP
jgi:mRNA-degrading endonuclease RelE of RelBE toxin-antitoxin system